MRKVFSHRLCSPSASAAFPSPFKPCPPKESFTYQGQLQNSGSPANGNYDFTFALFNNSSTNSGQIGSTLTDTDVGVTNGLFTVTLDFGSVFTGNATWLAIGVQTDGGNGFTPLNPLQELTPTPYATYASNAGAVAGSNIVGPSAGSLHPARFPHRSALREPTRLEHPIPAMWPPTPASQPSFSTERPMLGTW